MNNPFRSRAALSVALILAALGCGSDSTGVSKTPNPTPVLTSISPDTTVAGSAAVEITAIGSGFDSLSRIAWGASTLSTTFNDSSHLVALIPASSLTTPESVSVLVATPLPGGGLSATHPFLVLPMVPHIDSLSRDTATATISAFSVSIFGHGFASNATIQVSGTSHPVTFVNAGRLDFTMYGSDVASPGSRRVAIRNPGPGRTAADSTGFQVLPLPPAPTIARILPDSIFASPTGVTFQVRGTGFATGMRALYKVGLQYTDTVPASIVDDSTLSVSIVLDSTVLELPETLSLVRPGINGVSAKTPVRFYGPHPTLLTVSPDSLDWTDTTLTIVATGTNILPPTAYGSTSVGFLVVDSSEFPSTYAPGQFTIHVGGGFFHEGGTHHAWIQNPAGGGPSNRLPIVVAHPRPTIVSMLPSMDTVGGQPTLAITPSHWDSSVTAQVNGSPRSIVYRDYGSNLVEVTTLPGDLAAPGVLRVTLAEPTPGGGVSDTATLTIVPANPVPALDSVTPHTLTAGATAQALTLYGKHFIVGSTARVASTLNPYAFDTTATTVVDSSHLTVHLPDSLVSSARDLRIFVESPGPVAHGSDTVTAEIWSAGLSSVQSLTLPGSEMVSDTIHGLIYAFVSTANGGPRMAIISPSTGTETGSVALTGDVTAMALSSDENHLFVAQAGSTSLLRLATPTLNVEASIPLAMPSDTVSFLIEGAVSAIPGHPSSFATIINPAGLLTPSSAVVAVYDDSTRRTAVAPVGVFAWTLALNPAGDSAYAMVTGGSANPYWILTIDSDGVHKDTLMDQPEADAYPSGIVATDGNLFVDGGGAISAATGVTLGNLLQGLSGVGRPAVDPYRHRAYAVARGDDGTVHVAIVDSRSLSALGKVEFYTPGGGSIPRIVRWGTDGAALLGNGHLWIIHSSAIGP